MCRYCGHGLALNDFRNYRVHVSQFCWHFGRPKKLAADGKICFKSDSFHDPSSYLAGMKGASYRYKNG